MSISLLRLFSRGHYWVNKYILKMRVSSKELFLTLKNFRVILGQRRLSLPSCRCLPLRFVIFGQSANVSMESDVEDACFGCHLEGMSSGAVERSCSAPNSDGSA